MGAEKGRKERRVNFPILFESRLIMIAQTRRRILLSSL